MGLFVINGASELCLFVKKIRIKVIQDPLLLFLDIKLARECNFILIRIKLIEYMKSGRDSKFVLRVLYHSTTGSCCQPYCRMEIHLLALHLLRQFALWSHNSSIAMQMGSTCERGLITPGKLFLFPTTG